MTADKYTFEVQRLRDRMVAVATRMLDNCDEAEDVTQDALLKLWAVRKKLQESDIDKACIRDSETFVHRRVEKT